MDKIIDITERVPAMRQRRRRRANIRFILITIFFISVILLLLYFLKSSYSKIGQIEVSGNHLMLDEQYIELLGLAEGDELWGFSKRKLNKALLENDWIEYSEIKRGWPNHVEITVNEYENVGVIERNDHFVPVLENGVINDKLAANVTFDGPIFENFEDEKLLKKLLKQLAQLKPEVSFLISQIKATPTTSDPFAVTLFMSDGYEVRAEITTLAEKMNYYLEIVNQIESQEQYEKGVIDIEVGTYYTPFSQEYGNGLELNIGQEVNGDE